MLSMFSQLLSLSGSANLMIWLSFWFICSFLFPARHGDGLYDSYMRTDHLLKDDADTNSPSGLPPVPKHTVSIHTNTYARCKQSPISCAEAHSVSRHPVPQRGIPYSAMFPFIQFPFLSVTCVVQVLYPWRKIACGHVSNIDWLPEGIQEAVLEDTVLHDCITLADEK